MLADLHALFRGGREGEGVGPLRFILKTRGLPRVVDRLLPRYTRGEIRNAPPIEQLKRYLIRKEELRQLARLLTIEEFRKLSNDEDVKSVLEAFWRSVNNEFDYEGLNDAISQIEEILQIVQKAREIEKRAIKEFRVEGINFGEISRIIDAEANFKAFERLLDIVKGVINDSGPATKLVKAICKLIIMELNDVYDEVIKAQHSLEGVETSIDEFQNSIKELRRQYEQCLKAVRFAGLTLQDIDRLTDEVSSIEGKPTLQELQGELNNTKSQLDDIIRKLTELDGELQKLKAEIDKIRRG